MAQGELTKQEASHVKRCVDEIFSALPNTKKMNFICHLNDIFLFLEKAELTMPEEKKKSSKQ